MDLTEKAAQLYGLLFTKSFDLNALKKALQTGSFSKEEVNLAAYKYVDDCQNDLMDDDWEIHHGEPGEVLLGYESSHMFEAIRVLLEYGLDPNTIFTEALTDEITEEYNIMQSLRYIDNGYIAADTFSIGTNDLIQYTLAAERGNPGVEDIYSPYHPAVLRLIAMTAKAAAKAGIVCGMCGEMAADLKLLPALWGMGVRELSMSAKAMTAARETLSQWSDGDCEELARAVLSCGSEEELRKVCGAAAVLSS